MPQWHLRLHEGDIVVIVGAFLSYFIADGWAYSFGTLYNELLDAFKYGKGNTAVIGALVYGVPLLISPVVCSLTNVYGCRPICIAGGLVICVAFVLSSFATTLTFLCITTGIIASIGLCMAYVTSLVCVTSHFERSRGLAIGLAVTGSGLGSFAFPPMVQLLIDRYTWRGAFLVLGGVSLNICVAGALLRPSRIELREKTEFKERAPSHCRVCTEVRRIVAATCDKVVMKNVPFLLLCVSTFILYMWVGTPYVYLIDMAKNLLVGYSLHDLSFLLSFIGMFRTIGQLVWGILGDVKKMNIITLYAVTITMVGISMLLLPFCETYSGLATVAALFGFSVASTYSLQMMVVVAMVGLDKSTSAFGLLQLAQGISTSIGTPVAGGFIVLSSLMLFALNFLKRPVHRHTPETEDKIVDELTV